MALRCYVLAVMVKKNRGLINNDIVAQHHKKPFCKKRGFSYENEWLYMGNRHPTIHIGGNIFKNTTTLLKINGDNVLSIKPPKQIGKPYLINAFLCDSEGKEMLRIIDNEWQSSVNNWDMEATSKKIKIRKKIGNFALIVRAEPFGNFFIEQIDMEHKGVHFFADQNEMKLLSSKTTLLTKRSIYDNCGIEIKDQKFIIGRLDPPQTITKKTSIGRNEKCHCGSERKYKRCCGSI